MFNLEMAMVDTMVAETLIADLTTMEDATHIGMTPATLITIQVDSTDTEIIFTINQDTITFTEQDTGIPFITTNLTIPVLSK